MEKYCRLYIFLHLYLSFWKTPNMVFFQMSRKNKAKGIKIRYEKEHLTIIQLNKCWKLVF